MAETIADTRRLMSKPQNLNDAYGPPSNFLEIDVSNPQTVGVGRGRFTTYEIRVKTNLPIFKLKESTVRRRYSDFEWLRSELERESKVVVPPLPGKALFRQLPFRGDDGIFDDSFIEERKQGLEQFINKPWNVTQRFLHHGHNFGWSSSLFFRKTSNLDLMTSSDGKSTTAPVMPRGPSQDWSTIVPGTVKNAERETVPALRSLQSK